MEAGPAFLRGPGRLRLHAYCFLQVRLAPPFSRVRRESPLLERLHACDRNARRGGRGDGLWVSWGGREGRSGEPSRPDGLSASSLRRDLLATLSKVLETENGVIGPERRMDS
jgi:hypothetical protein